MTSISISFKYLIKAFESLKCLKHVLAYLLINKLYFVSYGSFAFPDPELSTLNILYGLSGISGQFGLCSFMGSSAI